MIDLSKYGDYHINEQPISLDGDVVGWHSQIHEADGHPVAGGTHEKREISRRIAVAEFIERRTFSEIVNDADDREHLLVDSFPSTCGFACGFDRFKTRWRSVCEGLERWAFSKWIDEHYFIDQRKLEVEGISNLAVSLMRPFDRVHLFEKQIKINKIDLGIEGIDLDSVERPTVAIRFRVFVGETCTGAFCGSRATIGNQDWSHEIIEARRNFDNFQNMASGSSSSRNSILLRRIRYFGENKEEALRQIGSAKLVEWPSPKLLLLKEVPTKFPNAYMWRCLFKSFTPWTEGPDSRFVI